MTSSNPIASTIILIFGMQAIVLIILLLLKRPVRQSNIFLALILFFFALMCINIAWLNFLITYNKTYLFGYFQIELIYGIGPSLFLFTKSITDPGYHISRKEFIHFIPVFLEFIYYRTGIYRIGLYDRFEIYQTGSQDVYQSPVHPYTIVYLIQQWVGIISLIIYIFASLVLFIRYRKWFKNNFSNFKNKPLGWLQIPVFFYSGFWIAWTILRSIDIFIFQNALKDFYFLPSFIGISVFTCWIGFKGYIESQTEITGFSKTSVKPEPYNAKPDEAKKIVTLMATHKPYLDPDLDLSKLSKLVKLNPKITSQIINGELNTNFYEFVNKYRVEEFKHRVQKADHNRFTLIAHAFESGFNSKSTFNHIFKKFTGQTPGEYYRQFKNMSERKHSDVEDTE